MFVTKKCCKSVSCDSLFYERSSLKRKLTPSTTSNNISFKNDDYNYLINCNDLIMTCKEALLENEATVIAATDITDDSIDYFQQKDDKLISTQKETQEPLKHSHAEFLKWLSYTERQLDTICYCANSNIASDWPDIISHHKAIQTEIENVGRRFVNEIKGSSIGEKKLTKEERHWHTLWLKSLEYLMILEEGAHCPQHYNINSVDEQLVPSKKLKNNVGIAASGTGTAIGIGIRNKRVQTKTTMVGELKNMLRNNFGGSKFEIIQKDIGYSSDADMSDAVEAHLHSDQNNLSSRTVRKRQVRRRRSRVPRTRPWSFHSDWTDWDYYQTPLNYGNEYNLSSENLYFDDDHRIRALTEFGENYETWICNDDDDLIRVSTPVLSQTSSSENEPKLSVPQSPEVPLPCKTAINTNSDDVNTTTRSSMNIAISVFIYAAIAIFILAISLANYSPHIEKIYPHRPPPI